MDTVVFVISKLVTFLILPESWILLGLILAFAAVLFRWHRLARWGTGLTLLFVVMVGFLPLGDMLIRPIEAAYPVNPPLERVDGIIVLGGSENPAASQVWQQPQFNDAAERVMGALLLARRFPDAKVISAGGSGSLKSLIVKTGGGESSVAARFFTDQGIDPARLIVENSSRNTAENARLTFRRINPGADQKFVLVTSAFHMPRAMRSFHTAGWRNVTPWPVDHYSSTFKAGVGWNLTHNLRTLNRAVKEWLGRLAYAVLGR